MKIRGDVFWKWADPTLHHRDHDETLDDAEDQRLNPHQVDLLGEEPARVVLAKAGRLHQRQLLEGEGVGAQRGNGFGEHRLPFGSTVF